MAEPSVLLADDHRRLDPELGHGWSACSPTTGHRRGVAAVIVTHDHDLLAVADRHVHLDRGALVEAARD